MLLSSTVFWLQGSHVETCWEPSTAFSQKPRFRTSEHAMLITSSFSWAGGAWGRHSEQKSGPTKFDDQKNRTADMGGRHVCAITESKNSNSFVRTPSLEKSVQGQHSHNFDHKSDRDIIWQSPLRCPSIEPFFPQLELRHHTLVSASDNRNRESDGHGATCWKIVIYFVPIGFNVWNMYTYV